MSGPPPVAVPETVIQIVRTLMDAGHEAWCVGGALRDALLGEPQSDFDVATSAEPTVVRRLFAHTIAVGEQYGTIGVMDRDRVLHEVTTFRRDVTTDGRRAVVAFGVSLQDDLARRDFTINAIAFQPVTGDWADPFGGEADLRARVLRAVGEPAERFREDYLRILRALRFAARFGLTIDPATWDAARQLSGGLAGLSAERVRDEWFKGLRTARDVTVLVARWREAGAADVWLPELRDPVALSPSLSAQPRDPVLLTVVTTRDAVAVLRRLKASNAEIARATAIGAGPVRPASAAAPDIRRWLAGTGAAADDLIRRWELAEGAAPVWAAEVEAARARQDPVARQDLAVNGRDLLAMGLRGTAVGEVLDRLLQRVLEDPSLNTRESLLELAGETP